MLQIAFIGALNQTNSIVSEMLTTHFDSEIEFISPADFFANPQFYKADQKDLVFIDINTSTGLGNAPQKVMKLKNTFLETPVLVMQSYEQARFSESLLKAGANGILSITPGEEELKEAVSKVMNNKIYNSFSD